MFTPIKKDNGYLPAMEYQLSTASESYKCGELLVLSGGKVTKCESTARPQYVCQETYAAPATGNRRVLCQPISSAITYQTVSSATQADGTIDAGSVVTVDSTGLKVTATATSGVATIVYKSGSAAGSTVHVKFL